MKELFHYAYDVLEKDGRWTPIRFTEKQLCALGKIHEMYERLGRCTSGVTLRFRTAAEEISFAYELGGFYTSTGGFDVYENGTLCANFPLPNEPVIDTFTYRKTTPGETELEIALPYHAQCTVWDLRLGDWKPVEPEKGPFLLFYGDSITQSAYTSTPSLAFTRLTAKLCDGRYLNRGVGSLFFDASVQDPEDTCRPDYVFIQFGGNDMVRRDEGNNVVRIDSVVQYYTMDDLPWLLSRAEAYYDKALSIYPQAKVIGITFFWSGNPMSPELTELKNAFREGIRRICRDRGLACIDGRTLTAHLSSCYAPDGTHLNALGGALTAQNLYLALKSL